MAFMAFDVWCTADTDLGILNKLEIFHLLMIFVMCSVSSVKY